MKKKKVTLLVVILMVIFNLSGCMASPKVKLPEGDVKLVNQQVQGVVELLLESADYGKDKSTVISMMIPQDSQYEVNLVKEQYKLGELMETTELIKYTTETIDKTSIVYVMINTGKLNDGEIEKSIYSIAEVDKEKTTDEKNPQYKIFKANGLPLDYDLKSSIDQVGGNLDEEIAIVGTVKLKEDDSEKVGIDLAKYKEQVSKYNEVNIIKIKVTKK